MGVGRALLTCCVLFVFYMLLAGSVSLHEAIAGVGCMVPLLVLVLAVHRGERRRLLVRPPLRFPLRVLSGLALDTGRVARVLCVAILRRPAGRAGTLLPVPFRHGEDRPREAGRRGLVTLAASLAPNGFVLAVPRTRPILLMHRLAPAPVPPDRDWPV